MAYKLSLTQLPARRMILSMTQLPEHEPASKDVELLTSGEVGKLLGVSDEAVNRWARDGKISHITLPSGVRRFRRDVIDAILAGTPATPSAVSAA